MFVLCVCLVWLLFLFLLLTLPISIFLSVLLSKSYQNIELLQDIRRWYCPTAMCSLLNLQKLLIAFGGLRSIFIRPGTILPDHASIIDPQHRNLWELQDFYELPGGALDERSSIWHSVCVSVFMFFIWSSLIITVSM